MSDETPKLTVRRKRFVKEVAAGKTQTEAIIAAGYRPVHPNSAATMGSRLMKDAGVQLALAQEMEKHYPDTSQKAAERLHKILVDENLPPMVTLKTIELLAKLFGWQAPTKSARLNVQVTDQWKLPEE